MHRKIFYYSSEIYMMAVALFGSEFTGWRWEVHDVIGIGGLCGSKVMYYMGSTVLGIVGKSGERSQNFYVNGSKTSPYFCSHPNTVKEPGERGIP